MQANEKNRATLLLTVMGLLFVGCSGRFDGFPHAPGEDGGGGSDLAKPAPEAGTPDLPPTPPSSWLVRAGGTFDTTFGIGDLIVDGAGNTYIAGRYFSGPLTIGDTTLSGKVPLVEHPRLRKLFVAKISPAGKFLWALTHEENDNDVRALSLDSAGNLYISGAYQRSPTFGATKLGNSLNQNAYVARVDPAGKFLWAAAPIKPSGQYGSTVAMAVALDSSDNIYLAGNCKEKIVFGATTLNCTKDNTNKVAGFMAMMDSAGKWKWAKKFGGPGIANIGSGVAIAPTGEPHFTGSFEPKATFGATTLTGLGGGDLFATRMDKAGNFTWAVGGGGGLPDASTLATTMDGQGNTIVTDVMSGPVTFGGITVSPTAAHGSNNYVTMVSPSGKFVWAVLLAGMRAWDISNDGAGNIYVVGTLTQQMTFGPDTVSPPNGGATAVVVRLDSAGKVLGAITSGATVGSSGWAVACDKAGNVYVSGHFMGKMTQGSTTITHQGRWDFFVWKIPAGTL